MSLIDNFNVKHIKSLLNNPKYNPNQNNNELFLTAVNLDNEKVFKLLLDDKRASNCYLLVAQN